MEVIEKTLFLTRNKNGELIPTIPYVLDELEGKVERLQANTQTPDVVIAWCLCEILAQYLMKIYASSK